MMTHEWLGVLVRNARLAKGLSQQAACRLSGVSRRQWALLEQGGNVSVGFLLKVAKVLDLTIPIGGAEELPRRLSDVNVLELFRIADELSNFAERLRALTLNAVLPDSERATSNDAAAVRAFAKRLSADGGPSLEKIGEAMRSLAEESRGRLEMATVAVPPAKTRSRKS